MTRTYRLLADRFDYKAGSLAYDYAGYDYGCRYDDESETGIEHRTLTAKPDGSGPFFTIPVRDIQECAP